MANNNSDYILPRTDLFELLPSVYKSDTNRAIFENLFNRFLSKDETTPVSGYLGEGNRKALLNRRIREATVHRQAFQLQPLLYSKIGSVENLNSWYDLLKEIARHGIDVENQNIWGQAVSYNWVPPVDIDKIINYRDYYWYEPDNIASQPDYITIKNPCNTATGKLSIINTIVKQFGLMQNIVKVFPSTNEIAVDKNFEGLFVKDFVLYVENSSNPDLNEKYHVVESSKYVSEKTYTLVKVKTEITSSIGNGIITMQPQVDQATYNVNCKCNKTYGWDVQPWDDNPYPPVWNTHFIERISHSTPSDWLNDNSPAVVGDIWWNINDNNVYRLVDPAALTSLVPDFSLGPWELHYTGEYFQTLINNITGTSYWDYTRGCDITVNVNQSAKQWIERNRWRHRTNVPDFARAKQAAFPIIEFETNLELNEWVNTEFKWKYRKTFDGVFEATDAKPNMFELLPIDRYSITTGNVLIFDEKCGDLTNIFVKDYFFVINDVPGLFKVVNSNYRRSDDTGDGTSSNLPWRTVIEIVDFVETPGFSLSTLSLVPSLNYLRPAITSQGDSWYRYHSHWLFDGAIETVAINHQPPNPRADTSLEKCLVRGTRLDSSYDYYISEYAQRAVVRKDGLTDIDIGKAAFDTDNDTIPDIEGWFNPRTDLSPSVPSRPLNKHSLFGFNDICVYLNGVRQHGTYDEIPMTDTFVDAQTGRSIEIQYVASIRFHQQLRNGDEVIIEVGENTPRDFGKYAVAVRTLENDLEFNAVGPDVISLIEKRKSEQTKTEINQTPLFDIYFVNNQTAYIANEIFTYKEDPAAKLNVLVGGRVALQDGEAVFENKLVETNNGRMYGYHNYARPIPQYWYNPKESKVFVWSGICWSEKYETSTGYHTAPLILNYLPVVDNQPSEGEVPEGTIVYDTYRHKLFRADDEGSLFSDWTEITSVIVSEVDPLLQTVWRRDTAFYTPEKVDWYKRTFVEFEAERTAYVDKRVDELAADPSLTEAERIEQATTEWIEKEAQSVNPFWYSNDQYVASPQGSIWVGNWEVPDPLYYNHMHENRSYVTRLELQKHFSTIINAQKRIPGYQGSMEYMFHALETNEIDFSLGGTIKEFDNSFDTFLSSVFVNNVTPVGIFSFAHEQYETLLLTLQEIFRSDIVSYLTTLDQEAITDPSSFVINNTIQTFETNDVYGVVYGDTTAFDEGLNGNPDRGVRNWIATLPFFGLAPAVVPHLLKDADGLVNDIMHHDGHLHSYGLPTVTINQLATKIVNTPDPRVLDDNGNSVEKLGRIRTTPPPNNLGQYLSQFSSEFRNGVYWYNKDILTLYRFTPYIGKYAPPPSYTGSLWFDITSGQEVLKQRILGDWEIVDGLFEGDGRFHNGTNEFDASDALISAWSTVDLNQLILDTILEVETRLYELAKDYATKQKINYSLLEQSNSLMFSQYLYRSFLEYVRQSEITTPFANVEYRADNPFTWNYRYTVTGTRFNLLEVDAEANTFTLEGNTTLSFTPGATFYIKNSGSNDGTWIVLSSVYDSGLNRTNVTPTTQINADAALGILYAGGLFPSQQNNGSESGGYWKDVYQKFFGTPYPHLEPWVLQGYQFKPDWWDRWYLNDEPDVYQQRMWKYLHQLNIVGVDTVTKTIKFAGNWIKAFELFPEFVLYTSTSKRVMRHTNVYLTNEDIPGYGVTDVTNVDVLSFPVLPTVDDFATIGMWENVVRGIIPPGEIYPNGIKSVTGNPSSDPTVDNAYPIPKYSYLCVNITNGVLDDGYVSVLPDGVLPPYWDRDTALGVNRTLNIMTTVRSLYVDFASVGSDYIWGDAGPIEWEWRNSSNFGYSLLTTSYRMYPVNTIQETFGVDFIRIDGLPIDARQERILSHNTTDFHGDIDLNNQPVLVNGVNQWYINYNRYNGYDANFSNFRALWTGWTAPLSYQFNALIDTTSLFVDHRNLILSSHDYEPTLKRSPGVANYWITGFNAKVLNMPPNVVRYDNENEWQIELNALSPLDLPVSYYDVRLFDFATFAEGLTISSVNPTEKTIIVQGDYTWLLKKNTNFFVKWSQNDDLNERFFTVVSSTHDTGANATIITVNHSFEDDTPSGTISVSTCSLYTYPIVGVDLLSNSLLIQGDVSEVFDVFHGATTAVVRGSVGTQAGVSNDKEFNVVFATYSPTTDITTINVKQPVTTTSTHGYLKAGVGPDGSTQYRKLPWETGFTVILSSTDLLPAPLYDDRLYFVIKISDTEFQLAFTEREAKGNIPIILDSVGYGIHRVGQLKNTFYAMGGKTTQKKWRHYAVDKSIVKVFFPPYNFSGMQKFVDIIDGYSEYVFDQGFRINHDASNIDYDTGKIKSWEVDVERFVDWAHQQRIIRRQTISDRYATNIDYDADTFDFSSQAPILKTGDEVVVWAKHGGLPSPLVKNTTYYTIVVDSTKIRLAASKADARKNVWIDIEETGGVGEIAVAKAPKIRNTFPTFEINPFREGIWFNNQSGIVSNVIAGPHEDILSQQLLTDQYGRRMAVSNIRVYREDKMTQIQVANRVVNDIEPIQTVILDPYHYIHLGGANLFIDTYEHVLLFNNYTTEQALIYDPFLGANATKIELDFNRSVIQTQRPSVGGHYLSKYYNQGASLLRNFEANVEDMRMFYDTYIVPETIETIRHSRALLGYEGMKQYLSDVNLNPKSQFLFWKGMIQNKGSMNAIKAFVNSKRFIDAKVDEYWAVKLADFGAATEKEYIEMWLKVQDSKSNDFRVDFINDLERCKPGYAVNPYDNYCGYAYPTAEDSRSPMLIDGTFNPVYSNDESRWYEFPDQAEKLRNNGGSMYFEMKPVDRIDIQYLPTFVLTNEATWPTEYDGNTGIVNLDAGKHSFYSWNQTSSEWELHGWWGTGLSNELPLFRHNGKSDLTKILIKWRDDRFVAEIPQIVGLPVLYFESDTNNFVIDGDHSSFFKPNRSFVYTRGAVEVVCEVASEGATYNSVSDLTHIPVKQVIAGNPSGGTIRTVPTGTPITLELTDPTNKTVNVPSFIPLTNSIVVYIDNVLAENNVDYYETVDDTLVSTQLVFADSVVGKTIEIVYTTGEFVKDVHYTEINSNIVQLMKNEFVTDSVRLSIWPQQVDYDSQNPAKIVDVEAGVVISQVQFWDPARGHHQYRAIHAVDIQSPTDPAYYNVSLDHTKYPTPTLSDVEPYPVETDESSSPVYSFGDSPWNQKQVGIVWLDTSMVDYLSYYDPSVWVDEETRLRSWGKLSDFGQVKVYQWTESDIRPDLWNDVAIEEQMDATIDPQERKSGAVKEALYFIPRLHYRFSPVVNSSAPYSMDLVVSGPLPNELQVDQYVLFSVRGEDDSLPLLETGELQAGTPYKITGVVGETITVDIPSGFVSSGTGTMTVALADFGLNYQIDGAVAQSFDPLVDGVDITVTNPKYRFYLDHTLFLLDEEISIYVDGKLSTTAVLDDVSKFDVEIEVNPNNKVVVVRLPENPSEEELAFQPLSDDTGIQHKYYEKQIEFTTIEYTNELTGESQTKYYFWVENKTTAQPGKLTILDASKDLVINPEPYVFFRKPSQTTSIVNETLGTEYVLPDRFTQMVVRGLRGLINDEQRYIMRFTRDFTLRDDLDKGKTPLELKNLHQEWMMIRREQPSVVPRWLWNKITEAIIGYKLDDPTIRVPSLDRELYDERTGTDTQYGLGDGQAFVNGTAALNTIMWYLTNPTNSFFPISIDLFFRFNNFDTPESTIKAMNEIYVTFNSKHTNAMFFEVLHDAFAYKSKYADIFKTSMVALHGIRLIEVQGIYDD